MTKELEIYMNRFTRAIFSIIAVALVLSISGCGKSKSEKTAELALVEAETARRKVVLELEEMKRSQEAVVNQASEQPATGAEGGAWVELICYTERSEISSYIPPPLRVKFQENGDSLIILVGHPEEKSIPAEITPTSVLAGEKKNFYIDRLLGKFKNGTDMADFGTCKSVQDKAF